MSRSKAGNTPNPARRMTASEEGRSFDQKRKLDQAREREKEMIKKLKKRGRRSK